MGSYDNRRKYERVKIKKMSKLNDVDCEIINISKEGMLLSGDVDSNGAEVNIRLKIDGEWISLEGTKMWVMNKPSTKIKRVGIYITMAPAEYNDFVDNLYLEAHQES